jgi:hypothetical protein
MPRKSGRDSTHSIRAVVMLADSSDQTLVARSRSRRQPAFTAPEFPHCSWPEFLEDKNWSDNRQVDGLISWQA